MKLYWWLAFFMGFRSGELAALTVKDVYRARGRLKVKVVKKVRKSSTVGLRLEYYAKGYMHRSMVVPRLLERPLLQRVDEVGDAGGSLLFPAWLERGPGSTRVTPAEPWIHPDDLAKTFVKVGSSIGWPVKGWTNGRPYVGADGRKRAFKPKPSSLIFHPHTARAFAASTMYAKPRGLSLRGMGMSISAISRQLGDTEETCRAHYLSILEEDDELLVQEVP